MEKRLKGSGFSRALIIFAFVYQLLITSCFSGEVKYPNAAGTFYPGDSVELSRMIDGFLEAAKPEPVQGDIFALISPHAGLGFSGQTASLGYKLVIGREYKTVVVIGPSHSYGFSGVSVYPEGVFRTPLGDLEVDKVFAQKLLNKDSGISFEARAFEREHSIEVQLPFLQEVLSGFKIVPIVMGDCTLSECQKLAGLLKDAIGERKDVLVVASSDMAHRYDFEEVEKIDKLTLFSLEKMDSQGLYYGFREQRLEMCGMLPVVTAIILAKESGYNKLKVLGYTNSAIVTGKKNKGIWTVGYASCLIDQEKKACLPAGREKTMLNKEQRKKLLEIARSSIQAYLKTGKKLEVSETDPALLKENGAFVTLHEHGELKGCIGNLTGSQPLYLTIRDMAVESATGDFRFSAVTLAGLKNIEIEISVLSLLERVSSIDEIKMGTHGVLVKKGFNSGVFLPQVAAETGWTKEEFLSNLCSHKAGLPALAWQDKNTEIYKFSAEVFSEKEIIASE